MTGPLIDAHVHVWDRERLQYPWLTDDLSFPQEATHSDLIASAPQASSFIFVQADCIPQQGLAEARWVNELAWPSLQGVVAFAPVDQGRAVLAGYLDELLTLPKVAGVRRLLQDEPAEFLDDRKFNEGLYYLADLGLPFDACVRFWQLPALARLCRRHPGLTVVLDHLGKPPLRTGFNHEDAEHWVDGIHFLAALPNVYVKLSGLPAEAPEAPDEAGYSPWLDVVLAAFGTNRALFGSDWPVSAAGNHGLTSNAWAEIVLGQAQGLTADEREDIAWRSAARAYALPGPLS